MKDPNKEGEMNGNNGHEEVVQKVTVQESRWHHANALIGIALIILMFTQYAFFIGAILVLIIFWLYMPKSYQRDIDHLKYAKIYERGVRYCGYAFVSIVFAYSVMTVHTVDDATFLQPWIPWLLNIAKFTLIIFGLLIINLEWSDKYIPWLTWKAAPYLGTLSGRRMPYKTKYLKPKKKPDADTDPIQVSPEGDDEPEGEKKLGRLEEIQEQHGVTNRPYDPGGEAQEVSKTEPID